MDGWMDGWMDARTQVWSISQSINKSINKSSTRWMLARQPSLFLRLHVCFPPTHLVEGEAGGPRDGELGAGEPDAVGSLLVPHHLLRARVDDLADLRHLGWGTGSDQIKGGPAGRWRR